MTDEMCYIPLSPVELNRRRIIGDMERFRCQIKEHLERQRFPMRLEWQFMPPSPHRILVTA